MIFAAGVATATETKSKAPSPRPWMESVLERGKALATRKVEAGSPAEEKWRQETKALIDDTLDWPELTEQAFGRQWQTLKPAQQEQFSKLLREMIEASYQSKLKLVSRGDVKEPQNAKIEWLEETVESDQAQSSARVRGDKNVAVLEFKMKWKNNRWRVWDVAIDDVSTVRTYRTQFGKLMGKEGFDGLIARMKTKTVEIREGRAEIGP
jgi:phospholipid transport system substrate-binding protein